MRKPTGFVYKITMPAGSLHAWDSHAVRGGPVVQLILVSFARLKRWDHDNLSAPYWRWYWNSNSGAAVRVHSEWIKLSPDRVVILPPRTPFATRLDAPAGHLFCHFSTNLQPLAAWRKAILHTPGRDEVKRLKRLSHSLHGDSPCDTHAVTLATHAMTSNLLAAMPAEAWDIRPTDDAVSRAMAILHEQPARTIANEELARMAAMSVNTLLRRFRLVTGTTPHQYAMQLRLANAMAALQTTNKSIEQISAESGFCDRYHLSRAFKRYTQASPAEFRKAAQRIQS